MVELQKAKDHNERLDGEMRVLRERVRTLDTEKKNLLEKVSVHQILINKNELNRDGNLSSGQMLDLCFYSLALCI